MPNKLTDAEVKKALKEYIEFADFEYTEYTSIRLDILKNALDLINRLEGENKKNETIIRFADKTIESLKAEAERLKEDIKILRVSVEQAPLIRKDGKSPLSLLTAEIKAEAYKEFAEKIKEKTMWLFSSVSINNEIDNLLNELVGDGDGKDS